jgi:hypothetical protein
MVKGNTRLHEMGLFKSIIITFFYFISPTTPFANKLLFCNPNNTGLYNGIFFEKIQTLYIKIRTVSPP